MPNNQVSTVQIDKLTPHPKNYRNHTKKQIAEIVESIKAFGIYKNVVTANDFTILAGHGVVRAAKEIGYETIPVMVLDLDPNSPAALKVLAADNELYRMAEDNDKLLIDVLRIVRDEHETGLLGTGFDDLTMAALEAKNEPAVGAKEIDIEKIDDDFNAECPRCKFRFKTN